MIDRLKYWYLELRHGPADNRLDYCRCGESWPCKLRMRWEPWRKQFWNK